MWLEEHFESSSTLQRNERVKLAASFWNNVGAGMVIGGMAAAFFLDKPPGAWTKIGSWTCPWLALLFNRQQHFNLFAHSTRSAPLGSMRVQGSPSATALDPVIMVTIVDEHDAKDRERLNAGVQLVLVKERFRPADLVERIRRLVHGKPPVLSGMEAAS